MRAVTRGAEPLLDSLTHTYTHTHVASHITPRVARLVLEQGSWAADLLSEMPSRGGEGPRHVDFVVLHASKRFFFGENETVWGRRNVGIAFFEEASDVQLFRVARAVRYDCVVLGCEWARRTVLRFDVCIYVYSHTHARAHTPTYTHTYTHTHTHAYTHTHIHTHTGTHTDSLTHV